MGSFETGVCQGRSFFGWDLGGKKMAGSKVSGFLLLFLVAHLAHGRDLELAPGGQGILSRIKSLQPTVPCQAYTAVMRSAIELGELPNEFECIGIVNELRITPPVPLHENLDERCRKSMENICRNGDF